MRHLKLHRLLWSLLLVASLRGAMAASDASDPAKLKPQGYLNDFAHVVDTPSRTAIENYCGQFERATGVQIALVTIPTLNDEPIEDWSNRLFHNWGIGQKGSSEGVMMLLVVNDHKSRIEVGYGLEQYLTDGTVGGILRQARPLLQQSQYGAALLQSAQQMGATISKGKGVELAEQPNNVPQVRGFHPRNQFPIPIPILLLIIVVFLIVVSKIVGAMNRSQGGNSRGYRGGGGPGVFWGGGGGFGGFGGGGGGGGGDSGGGFGGFGGGDSGGGGASSDW